MLEVTLYTRAGCHLCEDVEQLLAELAPRYPHRLRPVDIMAVPELHARYHLTIPVVSAAGRQLAAPIDAGQLEAFLQEARASTDG